MSDLSKAFGLIEEGITLLQSALDVPAPDTAASEKGGKGKARRRRKAGKTKKDAPPSGPNIEDARAALLEVVNAFEDGNDAVEEILGEVEKDVIKISEISPKNYQKVIDAAAQYLKDCEEDDD